MSGKNKRPRRSVSRPQDKIDSSLTDLSGKYYGQNIPIGKEQGDLFSQLLGLGSGLPGSMGTGSTGYGQNNGNTKGGLAGVSYDQLKGMFAGDSSYADLIKGMYGNSDFTALLKTLGIDWDHEMTASQTEDWNKQILDIILQQYANQEQRAYDRSVLSEQRTYDNPLNQLARLMGAGISRDAAIQMLSGSGAGAGAGSALIGSMGGQVSTGIPASQSELNGIQGKTAIANTVFGGINALAGLVSLGFSIPQAIQQTHYLQNQNSLTDRQIAAYDSTGRAFSILNAAGAAAESFGSVSSAAAALTQLAKDGNTDAAQFLLSGGLNSMRENAPFASEALGNLYMSERSSLDHKKLIEQQQRANDLRNWISENEVTKSYYEVGSAFMRLLQEEPRLAQMWQDVQEGKYDILIAGERYEQSKYQTTVAENAAKHAAFDSKVLNKLESYQSVDANGNLLTAADFISFHDWQNLHQVMFQDAVTLGDPRNMSKEKAKENRDNYVKFLNTNKNALYMGAFLDLAFKTSDAHFTQSWCAPLLGFGHALHSSGLGGVISTTASTASDVAVPLLLGGL